MLHKIAVIPGDGTGPEVVAEGLKVLKAVSEKFNFKYHLEHFDLGGERYLKTGEILPESALKKLKEMDVIYLGAIGHPEVKPGVLEQGILLRIRFQLDQYINLRPVKLCPGVETPLKDKKPEDIDFVVVRENTEGAYLGAGGFHKKGTTDEIAIQEAIHTRKGVERCIRYKAGKRFHRGIPPERGFPNRLCGYRRLGHPDVRVSAGTGFARRSGSPGFHSEARAGKKPSLGKHVMILGGGKAALEAARECVKEGAKSVRIVMRKSRDEAVYSEKDLAAAEQEGIRFHFQSALTKMMGEGSALTQAEQYNLHYGPLNLQIGAGLHFAYTDNVYYSQTNRVDDFLIIPEVTLAGLMQVSELNNARSGWFRCDLSCTKKPAGYCCSRDDRFWNSRDCHSCFTSGGRWSVAQTL